MCSARNSVFPCLALAVLVVLSGQAFADFTRVAVTPPGVPSCEGQYYAVFTTIQSAVNSVPAGGTVFICPGVYPEQVAIGKKITLQGVASSTQAEAIVVPPVGGMMPNATDLVTGNPIAAQIVVTAATVTINNLSVDGTGNGISGCSPDLRGILYQNSSGTIDHVAVRNEIPGGVSGSCSSGGEGIFVQSLTGIAKVTVETSSVHNYNTNGITGNGPGTNLTASGNYVQGSGVVSGGPVQNGIQLGYGAKGKITLNTVSENIYENATPTAANILLYDTAENSSIAVTNNILSNSQLPLALETLGDDGPNLGDGVTVTGNKIFGALGDAIDVCTNGNAINTNTIFGSTQSAVHFDTSCGLYFGGSTGTGNNATKNTFVESACAGILDDTGGAGGNITSPANTTYVVPFPSAYSTASCPFTSKVDVRTRAKDGHKKVSPIR
jgi:hypothetical protein